MRVDTINITPEVEETVAILNDNGLGASPTFVEGVLEVRVRNEVFGVQVSKGTWKIAYSRTSGVVKNYAKPMVFEDVYDLIAWLY